MRLKQWTESCDVFLGVSDVAGQNELPMFVHMKSFLHR